LNTGIVAATKLEVARGKVEPGAAELVDPDLERDPSSGRGLLEDHSERPAGEEAMLLARLVLALQVVRQVEHLEQLLGTPVRDPGERTTLQVSHEAAIVLPDT
jgi:hypothetical protein